MTATASWGQPRRRNRPASPTDAHAAPPAAAPAGEPDPEDVARLLARRRARRRAMDDTAPTSEETPS